MIHWRLRLHIVFIISFLFLFLLPAVSSSTIISQGSEEGLEVYHGPKLKVNIPERRLFVFDENDDLVKSYQIAVGRNRYKTPVGKRWINQIVWNPWWIPPKSPWAKGTKPVPPGSRNPLGPVKMKLSSSIMIHGTNKPSSVGRAASHGCMRMLSHKAKELARWLQESVTDKKDKDLFNMYEKNKKRSYYVNLTNKIPVDIVYELVEIKGKKLYVYEDIYNRVKNKTALIEKTLKEHGYDIDDIDMDQIKQKLKQANKFEITFDLNRLMVTKHNKQLIQFAQN